MEIIVLIAFGVIAGALLMWIYDRCSPEAYWRAYDEAQLKDLEYFREHPDCSYEEAHQYRDKVMKKFGRY